MPFHLNLHHEMIHHMQNLEGRLGNIKTSNTNEDDNLLELEKEAYLKGNITFRNWEDKIKNETKEVMAEGKYDSIVTYLTNKSIEAIKNALKKKLHHYKEGHFGIRIENLLAVTKAPKLENSTVDEMFIFETLNFVPIDKNLIDISMMTNEEKDWLNEYHLKCRKKIRENLEENEKIWLNHATKKIE